MRFRTLLLNFTCVLAVPCVAVAQEAKQTAPSQTRSPKQATLPTAAKGQTAPLLTREKDGIVYSVVSIERKGRSMKFGGATISGKAGEEVIELTFTMKAVAGAACCEASSFELQTSEGKNAEPVWDHVRSEKVSSRTFSNQFIAPEGARFKTFKVNGAVLDVASLLPKEKKVD